MLFTLENIIYKSNCGLYHDNGFKLLRNVKRPNMDQAKKNGFKIFKGVGFEIEIKRNLKIANCTKPQQFLIICPHIHQSLSSNHQTLNNIYQQKVK